MYKCNINDFWHLNIFLYFCTFIESAVSICAHLGDTSKLCALYTSLSSTALRSYGFQWFTSCKQTMVTLNRNRTLWSAGSLFIFVGIKSCQLTQASTMTVPMREKGFKSIISEMAFLNKKKMFHLCSFRNALSFFSIIMISICDTSLSCLMWCELTGCEGSAASLTCSPQQRVPDKLLQLLGSFMDPGGIIFHLFSIGRHLSSLLSHMHAHARTHNHMQCLISLHMELCIMKDSKLKNRDERTEKGGRGRWWPTDSWFRCISGDCKSWLVLFMDLL